jgi:glycosyltransferase involved in cell wall biosynthesis
VTAEPNTPGAAAHRGPGVRVVLDARPLQEPDRAPTTAAYLGGLLGAFDADPLAGESFALLLRSDLDDPTNEFPHLAIVGRRLMPPTQLLRSAALTVDPFVLRGASLGAAWRADRHGASGAVYHACGATVPLLSRIPTVVTLLDLAPWELPSAWQRNATTRFGQRLRAQLLRDAAAVIVVTRGVAVSARRLLHLRRDRVHVVPLAPRPAFTARVDEPSMRRERERLGLGERYFVYSGRYDARQDLASLFQALAALAAAGRPAVLRPDVAWPPRLLLVGASPDDRASVARAAARQGVAELLSYAPALESARLAALVSGARAAVLPVVSDAAGLAATEAIACGRPVIASAVGALPEVVGPAGILVEPRDPDRLAVALSTAWSDDRVHASLSEAARDRASTTARTWGDVARETRAVYAKVGVRPAQTG